MTPGRLRSMKKRKILCERDAYNSFLKCYHISRVRAKKCSVREASPLRLRNGARETREKTRKGIRGVGWEAHVPSRDPTLDALLRDPAWHVQERSNRKNR